MLVQSSGPSLIDILKKVYPVGTYYINETDSTSPATLFGFGTWTAVQDKMIMAVGSTYTAGTSGGSATLTSNVTVATQPTFTVDSHTHAGSSHTHGLSSAGWAQIDMATSALVRENRVSATSWASTNNFAITRAVDTTSGNTSAAGLGGATDAGGTGNTGTASANGTTRTADVALTNNAVASLPPYLTAYVWKRTA